MKIYEARDTKALAGLYTGGWEVDASVAQRVAAILADVRRRGDEALVEYTQRWDAPDFKVAQLRVQMPSLAAARAALPADVATGLELARTRVAAFHERQLVPDKQHNEDDGSINAMLVRPLAAVGAYVPGGTATLPSSVIMAVVPAKIAGVERVVVVTPPRKDGSIDPAVIFACVLCGADEVYAVGGAQAVAALAFGTSTITPVDKIVGPGNMYVTEAKRQVFGICGIDGLAGPSEVLVVADAQAKPEYVAGEIIAQAEHDPLARVAAVSEDRALLEKVAALLDGPFGTECGRAEIVSQVLAERTYLVLAANEAEILEVIERFAPEHLSIQTRDPWKLVPKIRRAGALFLGDETPVASGDYIAGSNHTLPTSGAGRFSSGLRTADFQRTMSLIENSVARMRSDAPLLAALADFEGLPAHARTARMRSGKAT
jgi:histidinol dehydrogenase